MSNLKIRFKGEEYIFPCGTLEAGGPIATPEQYQNFRPSFAHLFPNGQVKRHGEVIGTREDIEVIGTDDTEIESIQGLDEFSPDALLFALVMGVSE